MSEDERLVAGVVADIFMIQDSNSHPVFRLDLASHSNEVGLETIGQLEIKFFFGLLKRGRKSKITIRKSRQWSVSCHRELLQPLLLPQHRQAQRGEDQLPGDQQDGAARGGADGHLQHALHGDQEGAQEDLAAAVLPLLVRVRGLLSRLGHL